MTRTQVRDEALKLPVEERLELAYLLLDSADLEELPLHDWQKAILDRRLQATEESPEAWAEWNEVKSRVLDSMSKPPR